MRIVVIILLAAVVAVSCAPPARPLQRLPLVAPHDDRLPTYVIAVDSVRFTAALPRALWDVLCHPAAYARQDYAHFQDDSRACGGEDRCYMDPSVSGSFAVSIMAGEQNFRGVGRAELTEMLISAFDALGNVRVAPPASSRKELRPGEKGPYRLSGRLTELMLQAESSSQAFQGTAPPLALIAGEQAQQLGYLRFDMRLSDPQSGRLVAAFPVSGVFAAERISEYFGGVRTYEYQLHETIAAAARQALQRAAEETWRALQENGQ